MHLGMVAELTHCPVTESSKPYPQAKQMLPEGSQSLQLSGQARVIPMRNRISSVCFIYFGIIIVLLFN